MAELEERLTPQEFDSWVEYARLKGGVSPLSRIERAVWNIGALNVAATANKGRDRSFVKPADFMPEPVFNPKTSESGEYEADKVAELFGVSGFTGERRETYKTSSGLKIRSGTRDK